MLIPDVLVQFLFVVQIFGDHTDSTLEIQVSGMVVGIWVLVLPMQLERFFVYLVKCLFAEFASDASQILWHGDPSFPTGFSFVLAVRFLDVRFKLLLVRKQTSGVFVAEIALERRLCVLALNMTV